MPQSKKAIEATSIKTDSAPTADTSDLNTPSDRQSNLATILIGLLIIASGLLIYNYFQASTAPETTTISDSTTPTPAEPGQPTPTPVTGPEATEGSYTVVAGDTLWSVSEKVYGDGNRWVEIEQANELPRTDEGRPIIEPGQTLTVPNSAASTVATTPGAQDSDDSHTSDQTDSNDMAVTSYTVASGETLWSIAEQVYGDGNDWVKIFNDQANRLGSLSNGNPLIHSGNVLHIPR